MQRTDYARVQQLARIGLQADAATIDYLTSCKEYPFSIGSKSTIKIGYPIISAEDYENYSQLYSALCNIVFKANCTKSEKQIIADYLTALKKITAPAMMMFYEEAVPAFVEWVWCELN